MKPKLLKEIHFGNSEMDFWQLAAFEFLPHINVTIIRNQYFELNIGWLFWHIAYFK